MNDVRINLSSQMANAGMGAHVQKQLTPRHYGETKPNVPCTVFLLRCGSLWRAQQGSWVDDERHPWRRREFNLGVQDLRAELVRYQASASAPRIQARQHGSSANT